MNCFSIRHINVSNNIGNPPIETSGPFKPDSKEHKRRGLVCYNPQDLARKFPYIAKGSYGVVFKGRVPDVNRTVAIKDMDIVDSNVIEDWKKELTVMNQSQSPYVVEVFGYTNDRNVVTIVMEFMSRGDLFFDFTQKNGTPLHLTAASNGQALCTWTRLTTPTPHHTQRRQISKYSCNGRLFVQTYRLWLCKISE